MSQHFTITKAGCRQWFTRHLLHKLTTPAIVMLITVLLQLINPQLLRAELKAKPNIIFIMADDHAYQALSCYGSKINKTPNLDRIAKQGMLMRNCFVTNSICGPCRATILTGTYNHINGYIRNGLTFDGTQLTFPKLLQKAGYQTAAFGKWHLRSEPTGFDDWQILIGQGPYYNPRMRTPKGIVKTTGYTTDIITDVSLNWLKNKRDKNKPFFMMYQHKAPHRNWQPGPKYLNKYDDQKIPEPDSLFDDYKGRGTAAAKQEMTIERHMNPNDLKLTKPRGLTKKQLAAWNKAYHVKNEEFKKLKLSGKELVRWKYQRYMKDYLRCIASVDENVGRMLDYLDKSGLAKNTVVIYTSDQGFYLGEHGWYDKRWMYEESLRTPCMIRWPGKIKAGSKADQMVMNLDFAETFLDIAGVKIPDRMQGASMKPILLGEKAENWRKEIYYHYYEHPGVHNVQRHYGIRTDRYKLIRYYRIEEWELFDLEKDPHEMKSVYGDPKYREIVADLRQRLEKLRKKYKDDNDVTKGKSVKVDKVKLKLIRRFSFDGKLDLNLGKIINSPKGKALSLSGKAVAWKGKTSRVNSPAARALTIGAWCNAANGDGVILAQGGASFGWSFYLKDSVPTFALRNNDVLKTVQGKKIPLNRWIHLAVVLDKKGAARIYVNGQSQGKPQPVGIIASTPADGLSLGADFGSLVSDYKSANPFSGQLADVRYYWGNLKNTEMEIWIGTKKIDTKLYLYVYKNGTYKFNDKMMTTLKELKQEFEKVNKKNKNSALPLLIIAMDNEVRIEKVMKVMQIVKENGGISRYVLRSLKESKD